MRKLIGFLVTLILLAGLGYLLYPTVSNELAMRDANQSERYYLRRVSALQASQIDSAMSLAARYNAGLTERVITDVFSVPAPEANPEVSIPTASPTPEITAAPEITPEAPTQTVPPEDEPEDQAEDEPIPEVTPEVTVTPIATQEPAVTPEPTATPEPTPEPTAAPTLALTLNPVGTEQTEDVILHTPLPTAERATRDPNAAGLETQTESDAATPISSASPSSEPILPTGTPAPETELTPVPTLQGQVDLEGGSEGILIHPEAGPETETGGRIQLPAATAEPTATPEPPRTEILRYQDQLKAAGDVMGILEIPKLAVSLPFRHSREGSVIGTELIHVEGTDLPIGGAGLSVIAGPGRLPAPEGILRDVNLTGARMLENLGRMTGGDLFILRVLDQTLVYRVRRVWSVSPNGLAEIRGEENRDQVILMTAQGNQRILVQGERIAISEAQKELDAADVTLVPPDWLNIVVLGLPILIFGILATLLAELIRRRSYRLPTERKDSRRTAKRKEPAKAEPKADPAKKDAADSSEKEKTKE